MTVRRFLCTLEPRRAALLSGLAILSADQVSKWLIVGWLSQGEFVVVIPGFLHLTYVRNTGAAFGLLNDIGPARLIAAVAVALATFALIVTVKRTRPDDALTHLGLAAVSAGALGNLIDRLRLGAVVDFVDVFAGARHLPVFNLADVAIYAGVAALAVRALTRRRMRSRDQAVEEIEPRIGWRAHFRFRGVLVTRHTIVTLSVSSVAFVVTTVMLFTFRPLSQVQARDASQLDLEASGAFALGYYATVCALQEGRGIPAVLVDEIMRVGSTLQLSAAGRAWLDGLRRRRACGFEPVPLSEELDVSSAGFYLLGRWAAMREALPGAESRAIDVEMMKIASGLRSPPVMVAVVRFAQSEHDPAALYRELFPGRATLVVSPTLPGVEERRP